MTVRSKLTSKLVIGRAKVTSILHAVDSSAESIIDFDIEVLATSDQSSLITEWVSVFSASDKTLTPLGIVTPSIPETSVHFDKRIKKWILVGLYLSDSNVQSCTSPSIEGPWDCAYINKVQDLYSLDTNLITYAGKAHLDLINQDVVGDGINSMVISYVSNLADTNDLVFTSKYREVYIPKFTYIEQLER